MNKERLKRLTSILNTLTAAIETAATELEDIKEEEQESFDNLPETLQESDKANRMTDYIEAIEDLVLDLQDVEAKASSVTDN